MFEYAQELGRRKRSEPQDDVWTILSTVEVETDDGERTALGENELDMFFFLLTKGLSGMTLPASLKRCGARRWLTITVIFPNRT